MSLVGPRPERPHFVDQFCEAYPRVRRPSSSALGLTGWAQIHGLRGDTSIAERARFDNYYIENWSLWLDVKIMLRTAGPGRSPGDGGVSRRAAHDSSPVGAVSVVARSTTTLEWFADGNS